MGPQVGQRLPRRRDQLGEDAPALRLLVLDRLLQRVVRLDHLEGLEVEALAGGRAAVDEPAGCGRVAPAWSITPGGRRASGWCPPRAPPCGCRRTRRAPGRAGRGRGGSGRAGRRGAGSRPRAPRRGGRVCGRCAAAGDRGRGGRRRGRRGRAGRVPPRRSAGPRRGWSSPRSARRTRSIPSSGGRPVVSRTRSSPRGTSKSGTRPRAPPTQARRPPRSARAGGAELGFVRRRGEGRARARARGRSPRARRPRRGGSGTPAPARSPGRGWGMRKKTARSPA